MSKFVPDIHSERWVIIAPSRLARPEQRGTSSTCAFCPGNESMTPPEVYRVGEGLANKPGWKIRVIPNRYPITDIHEVIIHSPDDSKDIDSLPLEQVVLIFQTYRQRYNVHRERGQVLIFCNHGERAGASLNHPHSQLVVVPRQINMDILHKELVNNVIENSRFFVSYAPDFSQWPYEVWIAPTNGNGKPFGDSSDDQIADLATLLQKTIQKLVKKFPGLAYNYYIHHGKDW
ncbi:MAG: hypothetical protein QW303_08555, partial [Nitrososphaerota archaeon]